VVRRGGVKLFVLHACDTNLTCQFEGSKGSLSSCTLALQVLFVAGCMISFL